MNRSTDTMKATKTSATNGQTVSPRLGKRLRAAWDERPTIVRASYVINLEAELILAGEKLPERREWFAKLRSKLADLWFYRPIITTHAHVEDVYSLGLTRGIRRGETGRWDGDSGPTPDSPKPTPNGPTSRTTGTGRSLVAVS